MAHLSPNFQFGRRFCQLLPILFFFLPALIASSSSQHSTPLPTSHGCPSEMLQKCAEPLQQLGISSGKNLVLLLLQLHSPNQLRKSCLAYATALPCFRNLVHRCGVPSQTEILRQMENAHHFLCSPFSAVEQSQLLAHRVCIGRVLGEVGGGANCAGGGQNSSAMAVVLFRCRERCLAAAGGMSESANFGCLVRAWLSEQNLCLSEQLRAKCGREAAAFYTKMQRKIFHKQFPLICEPQNSRESAAAAQIAVQSVGDERKKSKKGPTAETKTAKSQSVTSASAMAPPSQPTIFVTSKKRVKTAARLSQIKLKFTGSAKRGSNNSSTTNANRNNGMNLKASRKSTAGTPSSNSLPSSNRTIIASSIISSSSASSPSRIFTSSAASSPPSPVTPSTASSPPSPVPASSAASPPPSPVTPSTASSPPSPVPASSAASPPPSPVTPSTASFPPSPVTASSAASPPPSPVTPSTASSLPSPVPASSTASSSHIFPSSSTTFAPVPFPSSSTSGRPPFLAFTSAPFAHSRHGNASSGRGRLIQLLAAQSVPFHFSSMVEQLHKRNKSENGGIGRPAPAQRKVLPIPNPSHFPPVRSPDRSLSSLPDRSSSSLPDRSSSSPPHVLLHPPHYSSVLPDPAAFSSAHSSPLLPPLIALPPLSPHSLFPAFSAPFASQFWSNGHNDNLQQRDGTSRMFFFEVLPIDEMLHNA